LPIRRKPPARALVEKADRCARSSDAFPFVVRLRMHQRHLSLGGGERLRDVRHRELVRHREVGATGLAVAGTRRQPSSMTYVPAAAEMRRTLLARPRRRAGGAR